MFFTEQKVIPFNLVAKLKSHLNMNEEMEEDILMAVACTSGIRKMLNKLKTRG
jgi:hypothetical protein